MDQVAGLSIALALAMVGVIVSWVVPGHCVCDKCAFHRAERLKDHPPRDQVEMQHEVQHKGFGFNESSRDYMDCHTKVCPRNTHNRVIGP